MRHRHLCPKCGHNKILLIASVADVDDGLAPRPMQLAVAFAGKSFFGGDRTEAAGLLGAAVCKRCGHTELHVDHPASIPIDGTYVREVSGPETDTPYR